MIKILVRKESELFNIFIEGDRIFYLDKLQGQLWGGPLQYLPPSRETIRKIDMSRNRIPQIYKELLKVTDDELAEYESAKGDENKLKDLAIRDAKKNRCTIVDIKIE